jgi:hypothetical protein
MKQFILLLHEQADEVETISAEEMQANIARYSSWAQALGQQGKLVGGEKLADDGGKILRAVNGDQIVSDGPYSETKDVVGGYFIIRAADYAEAAEIAKTCPHAERGRPIEIRHQEYASD